MMVEAYEGVVTRDYAEVIDLLVKRRKELGLRQIDVDIITGFSSGYTSKIEAWQTKSGRGLLSPVALNLLLPALGLSIVVVAQPNPDKQKRRQTHANVVMDHSTEVMMQLEFPFMADTLTKKQIHQRKVR